VFAECLAVGLACGDQRRLTGSGSALEALRDDALYKSMYFTFLLFYGSFCANQNVIIRMRFTITIRITFPGGEGRCPLVPI